VPQLLDLEGTPAILLAYQAAPIEAGSLSVVQRGQDEDLPVLLISEARGGLVGFATSRPWIGWGSCGASLTGFTGQVQQGHPRLGSPIRWDAGTRRVCRDRRVRRVRRGRRDRRAWRRRVARSAVTAPS
jgi:hypothetical protein